MPSKFEDKIIGRILSRLQKDGVDAAHDYGFAVCGGNPHIIKAVLSSAPEPLKTKLIVSFELQRAKRQAAQEKTDADYTELERARELVRNKLRADYASAQRIGQSVVFLAGLSVADRDACKPLKQEVLATVAMRRDCIRSTKVMEILDCTDTELKRWSEDGRLPVMFRRRMPSSVGKTLEVRHWNEALVQQALLHISQWRADDAITRRNKKGSTSDRKE